MKKYISDIMPYIYPIFIFFFISFAYFVPDVIQGKKLFQSDVVHHQGMAKEIIDYREHYGEEPLWSNSMFGGMPAYLTSTKYNSNFLRHLHTLLTFFNFRPVCFLFLYLLGFYIALLLFDVKLWLSFAGAIAYAFSSYFFVIIMAGHVSKVFALGYMPPIIAGVYSAFRGKPVAGSITAGLFLGLQIVVNHMQITYYTLLTVFVLLIFELVRILKEKSLAQNIRPVLMLAVFTLLAIGANISTLWTTWEYGKYSMRGKSELTTDDSNQTSGLDKDYATQWSYGIGETITLLIPNFEGGSSSGELSAKSETYNYIKSNYDEATARSFTANAPVYHGTQPSTQGPVYVGAAVVFLFILGMFLIKGPVKWWLFTITVISIVLSWGRNFPALTNFMLDYFPGYNKFRTVSMTLVIAEFAMPLLSILTLKEIMDNRIDKKEFIKAWKYTLTGTGGFLVIILLISGSFNFTSLADTQLLNQGLAPLVDALEKDRLSLLRMDTLRSLVFLAITAFAVLALYNQKLKYSTAIVVLSAIFLVDMWPVNKRYLNSNNFVTQRDYQSSFSPTAADNFILQDNEKSRVLNLTVSVFQDASTSYFHHSIGGYHGAKMKRYQELIDHHLFREIELITTRLQNIRTEEALDSIMTDLDVLNMLNTKYMIFNPDVQPFVNKHALGHAWLVNRIIPVNNADEEIAALGNFNAETEALVDIRYADLFTDIGLQTDTTAYIKLTDYKPNHLTYGFSAKSDQIAVFSEIYYDKGWNAFIDGEPAEYARANYLLRAMKIPAGDHNIEFRFHPVSYYAGEKISLASSILLILLVAGSLFYAFKQNA